MAKFNSSTFGLISGRHGEAVACVHNGKNYIRLHKDPFNPQTDKQTEHRAKFAFSVRNVSVFNPIFKVTGGNSRAVSALRKQAFKTVKGKNPDFEIDYENLILSKGTIPMPGISIEDRDQDGSTIYWLTDIHEGVSENDTVNIVVFEPNSKTLLHYTDVATRIDGQAHLKVPDKLREDYVYVWAYMSNGNRKSNSIFLGKQTI